MRSGGGSRLAADDPFILQLDVGKTDFFEKQANPTYLYYNPWEEARDVTVRNHALKGIASYV